MTDILLNTDNDLQFSNGDFITGYSDDQHIQNHLEAEVGNFYQYPFIGVGIRSALNAPVNRADLQTTIRKNLVEDNFNVREINISGDFDNLIIDINAQMK